MSRAGAGYGAGRESSACREPGALGPSELRGPLASRSRVPIHARSDPRPVQLWTRFQTGPFGRESRVFKVVT